MTRRRIEVNGVVVYCDMVYNNTGTTFKYFQTETTDRLFFCFTVNGFPACCGAQIFSGFYLSLEDGPPNSLDIAKTVMTNQCQMVTLLITVVHDEVSDWVGEGDYTPLYEMLEGMGRIVSTFKNMGHDSTLRLVQIDPHKLGKKDYAHYKYEVA